ncbi:MAG: ProQ/FinO family protein [Legionella sp.]
MRKQELHPRTAILNKSQKNHSKRARTEALAWLSQTFPVAFDNSLCIRPLKIGIMDDILLHADKALAAGISKAKLREAVVLFTRRIDYLACLKAREMRVDLAGVAVSEVTEDEASLAAGKIKKRVEKSIRNARKALPAKANPTAANTSASSNQYAKSSSSSASSDDYLPTYPPRSQAYAAQNATTTPARTASVIVKHKTTRQYDPSAVARLKEKLGLSLGMEDKKEVIE